MARHSIPRTGGTSKFRMVVIDAELQEGEISQLAQAIQGAFSGLPRGSAVRPNGSAARSLPSPDSSEISAELDGGEIVEDVGVTITATVPPSVPARSKAHKKLRTPNLDGDLHPEADPSFKSYAEARSVTGATKVLTKFLIVGSW